jgi:hypothetical protein
MIVGQQETFKYFNDFRALKQRIVLSLSKVWLQIIYLDSSQTFSGLFVPENTVFLC